jgi:hypothetical protein
MAEKFSFKFGEYVMIYLTLYLDKYYQVFSRNHRFLSDLAPLCLSEFWSLRNSDREDTSNQDLINLIYLR